MSYKRYITLSKRKFYNCLKPFSKIKEFEWYISKNENKILIDYEEICSAENINLYQGLCLESWARALECNPEESPFETEKPLDFVDWYNLIKAKCHCENLRAIKLSTKNNNIGSTIIFVLRNLFNTNFENENSEADYSIFVDYNDSKRETNALFACEGGCSLPGQLLKYVNVKKISEDSTNVRLEVELEIDSDSIYQKQKIIDLIKRRG